MSDITTYYSQFPEDKQLLLKEIHNIIKEAAPEASEIISWDMPTFYQNGNLVHYAMCKTHIGFYPTPNGVSNFSDRLTEYKCSKGCIQFPLSKPLPKELIQDIVRFRVKEQVNIAELKLSKKKSKEN